MGLFDSVKNAVNNVRNSTTDTFNQARSSVDQTVSNVDRSIDRSVRDVTQSTTSMLDRARDEAEETADEARDTGSSIFGNVSRSASSTSRNVSSTVDRTIDRTSSAARSATGVDDYLESDTFRQRQREAQEADSVWEGFDTAVATGTDVLFDNPNASIQGGTRGVIGRVTGAESDEDLAQQFQAADRGVTSQIDRLIGGTALDNSGTDALRSGVDLFLNEGIRTGVGAATGIDTEEGDLDARTGAFELADVGLTVGTAGAGRVAAGAGRTALGGVGDVFSLSRGARGADEAASTISRSSENVTSLRALDDAPTSQVDEASSASTSLVRSTGDTLTRSADDLPSSNVVRQADEAGSASRSFDDIIDIGPARTTRSVDEAAEATTRSVDDAGSSLVRSTDDTAEAATRSGDDLVSRIRATIRQATPSSRRGRIAAAAGGGAAALVGGGAVVDELRDRYELEGGTTLVKVESYPATEVFTGGVNFEVRDGSDRAGYTVIVAETEDGQLVGLDENGDPFTMSLSSAQLDELARGAA